MTETIEQFAARVCLGMGFAPPPDGAVYRQLVAFLATLPPRVVDIPPEVIDAVSQRCVVLEKSLSPTAEHERGRLNEWLRVRAPLPAPRPAVDVEAVIADFKETHRSELLALNDYSAHRMNIATADLREVLTRHVTDTGWITVPTTQTAGELVVPEDGVYVFRHATAGVYAPDLNDCAAGYVVSDTYAAIRRIDTDAPTTWIERSTTTTQAWTPESVKACVGRIVAIRNNRGTLDFREFTTEPAGIIAEIFDVAHIDAWCLVTLPEVTT